MKTRAGPTGPARGALSGINYEPAMGLTAACGVWMTDDFAWAGSESSGGGGAVDSVNGYTGVVVLGASDVGAQPLDTLLTNIAALSMVADRYIYGTGTDTVALGTITAFARTILDDVDAAAVRTTIGAGTGSGDVVGPGSASDNHLARYDGTTGELLQDSAVHLTDTGALRPATTDVQQLGNKDYIWQETWALQYSGNVQAAVQAPSGGWTTSQAAFWTITGGTPKHTYNGTTRDLLHSGTAVTIAQGGTGQTTASAAFGALKQDATTTASGVVELGTWAEGQSTSSRVEASNSLWLIYDPRRPLWGRTSHLVLKNALTGFGVWDSPTISGTFTPTSQVSGTYGGWRRVTCTTTARGYYAGNTSSILTWDLAPYVRSRYWLGISDITSVGKCFGALATITTGPAEVIAAESAVTRCVRFGIDNGAFKAYTADGTARTATSFTATPSDNVMYCFEIVMLRSGSVKYNLYSWTLDAGLTLTESKTVATNVPTGSTGLWNGFWCAAASGSPTVMFGDAECVLNLE